MNLTSGLLILFAELALFDLVEEVNQNFYELLGLPQVCDSNSFTKKCCQNLRVILNGYFYLFSI